MGENDTACGSILTSVVGVTAGIMVLFGGTYFILDGIEIAAALVALPLVVALSASTGVVVHAGFGALMQGDAAPVLRRRDPRIDL
jgi:hypothetical protein